MRIAAQTIECTVCARVATTGEVLLTQHCVASWAAPHACLPPVKPQSISESSAHTHLDVCLHTNVDRCTLTLSALFKLYIFNYMYYITTYTTAIGLFIFITSVATVLGLSGRRWP